MQWNQSRDPSRPPRAELRSAPGGIRVRPIDKIKRAPGRGVVGEPPGCWGVDARLNAARAIFLFQGCTRLCHLIRVNSSSLSRDGYRIRARDDQAWWSIFSKCGTVAHPLALLTPTGTRSRTPALLPQRRAPLRQSRLHFTVHFSRVVWALDSSGVFATSDTWASALNRYGLLGAGCAGSAGSVHSRYRLGHASIVDRSISWS